MKPSLKQQLPPGETGAYLFPLCVSLLCYCQGNDKEPHLNCCFQVRGWSFVSCLKEMVPGFLLFLQERQATLSHFWKVLGLPKTVLAASTTKEVTEGYYLPVEVLAPIQKSPDSSCEHLNSLFSSCSSRLPFSLYGPLMFQFLVLLWFIVILRLGDLWEPGKFGGGRGGTGSFNPVEPKPFCLAMASLYLAMPKWFLLNLNQLSSRIQREIFHVSAVVKHMENN